MILQLEAEFHLGLGGFSALPQDEQARLLAYARVKADPAGESRRSLAERLRLGR